MNVFLENSLPAEISNYTWSGVFSFLNEQFKRMELERTQWLIEKQQLTEKNTVLEGELRAQGTLNKDLLKRVKMLEFSLRQERIKYAKLTGGHHRVNSEVISNILARTENRPAPSAGELLPKRRTRVHRQMLSKYLLELGLDDIFSGDMPARSQPHHRASKSSGAPLQIISENMKSERQEEPGPVLPEEKLLKQSWENVAPLKGHFDGVRAVYFTHCEGILATASEDCTVKLWDINGFESFNESTFCDAFYTLRGHKTGVFCLTGFSQGNEQLLYSGDGAGQIFTWELHQMSEMDSFGTQNDRSFSTSALSAHSDVVWDLQHHPYTNQLLSVSGDGTVKLWKTHDLQSPLDDWDASKGLLKSFQLVGACCAWMCNDNESFAVGAETAVHLLDASRGPSTVLQFTPDVSCQANAIVSVESLVIVGHEDRHIRCFDVIAGKCVKDFVGHTDSVSCLLVGKEGNYLVSGGNDGSIRFWDLRTFQCLHEVPAHRKKYDEGVHSLAQHSSFPLLASGGADSLIRLFSYSET